jgi:adenylate kinase family enzyme
MGILGGTPPGRHPTGETAVIERARPDGSSWPSWLLVGPTGSGKSPLGRLFENRGLGGRRCRHFDFGAELRAAASERDRASELSETDYQVVRRSLSSGALLEDGEFPIALKVLRAFVRRKSLGEDELLVLNGLPRHIGQARMMDEMIRMLAVVSLEAPPEVVRERIRLNVGGDRLDRPDDDLQAVRKKLVIFQMRTRPLIEYYENREIPVFRISVGLLMTAPEMYNLIVPAAVERGIL